jgi:hypothetical protein
MLHQLGTRNVSLVKLGAWATFAGQWVGGGRWGSGQRVLEGQFQFINVSSSYAAFGYGFTYFFSRAAAEARMNISKPVGLGRPGWDGQWIGALARAGFKMALVNNHPLLLVIKVQHGENISRLLGHLVRRLEGSAADHRRALALLRDGLPVKLRDSFQRY